MNPLRLILMITGGGAALAWGAAQWARSHRKSPEQIERERRQRLCLRGRICDGNVLDVQEVEVDGVGTSQFIIYSYEIGGVSYQASQDITHLRHFVDVNSCKLGLPTSVRYNPQNPGDSIVIAEEWKGLRG
ncbi:MAG: DUF3592 domain-containing protein [Terriglobales bacterium]